MAPIQAERLVVVSLRAQNVPEVVHFYRDVIGLQLIPHHGQYPAFSLGQGAHLVIVRGSLEYEQVDDSDRFPAVAFAVSNLDAAVEHLGTHGVELPWGVEVNQSARWVMFYDPAGNLIELAEFH